MKFLIFHAVFTLIALVAGKKSGARQLPWRFSDSDPVRREDSITRDIQNIVKSLQNTKRLAVLITGLEDGFVWAHAEDRLVEPARRQNYSVDFYLRLVSSGKQNGVQWNKIKSETSSRVDVHDWQESISRSSGAEVKFLELLKHKEDVYIPEGAPLKISTYSPVKSEVGRNMLRRFKSLEYLMHRALKEEKSGQFRYDFVMVAREDPTWLSPLNMHRFNQLPSNQNAVFSKNCLQFWQGLNDKVFVFGREAAAKTLTGLYTEFWTSSADGPNAEKYWKVYIASKGVVSNPVAPEDLPASDTRWQSGRACQQLNYHCKGTYDQQPTFCKKAH